LYLVDTRIISSRATTKSVARDDLANWMEQAASDLYLSVVTVTAIESGISQLFRKGATKKAGLISEWWSQVEFDYGSRILPFGIDAAHMTGKLLDRALGKGHNADFGDAAIAATAFLHGYTILTDNERHFEPFGVQSINAFNELPPLPGARPATPSL
jgi:predicted nucleic acid-binding protein